MKIHASEYPAAMMRQVLGVSRSGYYAWRRRPESQRQKENRKFLIMIKAIHRESRQTTAARTSTRRKTCSVTVRPATMPGSLA